MKSARTPDTGALSGRDMPQPRSKAAKSSIIISGEEMKNYAHQQVNCCAGHFVCATLGVLLVVTNNEIDHKDRKEGGSGESGSSAGLKGAALALTLLGLLFLYKYYDSKIALKRLAGVKLAPGVTYSSLRGTGLLGACLLDVLVMLPIPLPGVDFKITVWNKGLGRSSTYSSDAVFCILCMFLRCFYLPRFYGECISDLASNAGQAFARLNRIKLDETFTIKYVLANSLDCVGFVSLLSVLTSAYAMMVFERPVADATLGHYSNCIWLIVITMTTVGYGDEYPTTFMGRVISIMASIAAVMLLAITVNLVITKLSLSRAESKVVEIMDRVNVRRELKQRACIAMQRWIRAYQAFASGTAAHTHNSAQAYMVIPEMHSSKRKNQDMLNYVWSNLPLLEALNDLKQIKRDNDVAHMRCDVGELAGSLQVFLKRISESITGARQAEGL